ncbi:reverse transcriptase domain-containing protein [Tanacetum coccineum]
MGGSSSQPRTDPPMSPIHAFPIKDMYTPEFSDSFQQNIGSIKEIAREDYPVEVASLPPKTKSKPTRGCQKRTIQSDDAPQHIAWINAEEIALSKGWIYVSENNIIGNTEKEAGFWSEILKYMESKTKQYGSRTLQESGILKGSPKWMQSEVSKFAAKSREGSGKIYKTFASSSFNTESVKTSINPNVDVGDDEEDEVQEIRRPIGRDKAKDAAKKKGLRALGSSSMNDEALARLMVSEMATQNEHAIEMQREERLAFLEIKRREVGVVNESWQIRSIDNAKKT